MKQNNGYLIIIYIEVLLMFSEASNRLPYFAKYLNHSTAKECVKGMYKADKKGKLLFQFVEAAVEKSDFQKDDQIKRLLVRAFELAKEKELSGKVKQKFGKIKPHYKDKLKQATEKLEALQKAQKELEEKKGQEKKEQQKKEHEQAAQKRKEALEKEKLEEQKRLQDELKEKQKQEEIRKREEKEKAEKQAVQARLSQNAETAVGPNFEISQVLYAAILTARDELIQKGLFEGDDIADMMGESYEATIDIAVAKILKKSFIESDNIIILSDSTEEFVFRITLPQDPVEILTSLHDLLKASSKLSSEQHESLKLRLLKKEDFVSNEEKLDLDVDRTFKEIGRFRIVCEQKIMNMCLAQGDTTINLQQAFQGETLQK